MAAIIGTKLKYVVNLSSPGFSMNDDNFYVDAYCGGVEKRYEKTDFEYSVSEEKWYLTIDTSDFQRGDLTLTFYACVPDDDFKEGYRLEADRKTIETLVR